ncbi:MAG TPA: hypothetical protein VMF65_13895 [Acidimicrobiales bacterium]|nr:hypothetical protein [Acidimicrobiales bacterium]
MTQRQPTRLGVAYPGSYCRGVTWDRHSRRRRRDGARGGRKGRGRRAAEAAEAAEAAGVEPDAAIVEAAKALASGPWAELGRETAL